jgi:hypothetical protein
MATTYVFPVEFEGIGEVSSVKLKSNIKYLESLKFMVEYAYAQKYAKVIKIQKLFYYNRTLISQVRVLGLTMQKRNTTGER